MSPGLSTDLQRFIQQKNPSQIEVVITPASGRSSEVEQRLDEQGVDYRTSRAGSLTVISTTLPSATVQSLAASDSVRLVELDQRFSTLGADVMGMTATNLTAEISQRTLGDSMEQMGVRELWQRAGHKGDGWKIGVIDTPVDPEHPALEPNIQAVGGGSIPGAHGTWVAGAAAAKETEIPNSGGKMVHGAAPDADLYCYGAFTPEGAQASDIVDGLQFCIDNNVDVVNMSFGGPHSGVAHEIVQEAKRNGIVPVVAAGNSGPASGTVQCPAHHEASVCVASVQSNGMVSEFSSRGPGEYEDSNVPEIAAPGGQVIREDGRPIPKELILGPFPDGEYGPMAGTSMAAPHIAGLTAFVEG